MRVDPETIAEELRKEHRKAFRLPPEAPGGIGLGDAVAVVARPIARASDALLGTKLVGCTSCAERQARWNAVRLG